MACPKFLQFSNHAAQMAYAKAKPVFRGPAQREELKIQPDPTGAALDRRSGDQVAAEEPMVLFLA